MNKVRSSHRRSWMGILGVLVVLTGIAGSLVWVTQSRADDPQSVFPRAVEAGKAAGDAPAAIVNGVEIPKSTIATMQVLMAGFPESAADANSDTIIDLVLRDELFLQEAERRGLVPSEDEITQFIVQQQKSFQADLAAGKAPQEIVNIIEGQAKIGHPIENWPNDAVVRKAYRYMLAQSALTRDETKDFAPNSDPTKQLSQARMDKLADKLRQQGSVEILP